MVRKKTGRNQPATKQDITDAVDELAQATKRGFDAVDKRFDSVDENISGIKQDVSEIKEAVLSLQKGQEKLQEGQQALLKLAESNTQAIHELRHLPAQVERLNRTVFHSPR